MEEQSTKHAGGRPFKFLDLEDFQQRIRSYFDSCDPHVEPRVVDGGINQKGETIWLKREVLTEQKPYTTTGLARALGTSRQTLLEYEKAEHYPVDISEDLRDQLIDTVANAKARCQEFAEGSLFSPYANGAKFNLQNNHGWEDRKIQENEGGFFDTGKIEVTVVQGSVPNPETPIEDSEPTTERDAEPSAPATQ
jgi:DNA-packaging protein gp3